MTIAQREIPAKTNEIPEIKPLLAPWDLCGRVVTADALHTQRESARFLVEDKQAHYLFTVKENQPTLFADLSALGEAHFPLCAETLDKGYGRLEQRRLLASTALNDDLNFPDVAQVCRIERAVTELKSGKQRSETVFAITSLAPAQADPHKLLQLNRAHWAIENRSHYVRDMAFDEDRSRIRVGTGAVMMACLRNFASALRAFAQQPRRALAAVGV